MRGIGWPRKTGKYTSRRRIIMIDLLSLAFALIAGIMLGAIFFGGLWWTVRKGVSAKHPAFWFFYSMLLRTCIVLLESCYAHTFYRPATFSLAKSAGNHRHRHRNRLKR